MIEDSSLLYFVKYFIALNNHGDLWGFKDLGS